MSSDMKRVLLEWLPLHKEAWLISLMVIEFPVLPPVEVVAVCCFRR